MFVNIRLHIAFFCQHFDVYAPATYSFSLSSEVILQCTFPVCTIIYIQYIQCISSISDIFYLLDTFKTFCHWIRKGIVGPEYKGVLDTSSFAKTHVEWTRMDLNGLKWIWMDSNGFEWIWTDLNGFDWIWVHLNKFEWSWTYLNFILVLFQTPSM